MIHKGSSGIRGRGTKEDLEWSKLCKPTVFFFSSFEYVYAETQDKSCSYRLGGEERWSAVEEERRKWVDGGIVSEWKGFNWIWDVAQSPLSSLGKRWWAVESRFVTRHALDKISGWHGTLLWFCFHYDNQLRHSSKVAASIIWISTEKRMVLFRGIYVNPRYFFSIQ